MKCFSSFSNVNCLFLFYFLAVTRKDFSYHYKRRIFDDIKPSGARNFGMFWTASHFSLLFPDPRTYYFVSVTDFVTILCVVFITNTDILIFFFCHETSIPTKLVHPLFLFLNGKLWNLNVFSWSLSNRFEQPGQNTTAFSRKKPDKRSLTVDYWASSTSSFPPNSSWAAWRHA